MRGGGGGKGAKSRRSRAAISHGRGLGRRHTVHVRFGGYGQLGHGDEEQQASPKRVEVEAWQGRKSRRSRAAEHTAVVLDDGTLYTFGMAAMVDLGMEIGAAGIAEARGGGGVARAQSHVGRVRPISHGRGLGRRHTVHVRWPLAQRWGHEARGGGGKGRSVAWAIHTAGLDDGDTVLFGDGAGSKPGRDVADQGTTPLKRVEVEGGGIAKLEGGPQSHVRSGAILDDGTLYTFGGGGNVNWHGDGAAGTPKRGNWTLRSSSGCVQQQMRCGLDAWGARVLLGRKRGPWRIRLGRRCSCSSK